MRRSDTQEKMRHRLAESEPVPRRSNTACNLGPGTQCVVNGPRSVVTLASGLNTNWVPPELPPQRMPASLTLVPLVTWKTSEPLSPPPTPADTKVWHSWTMLEPETPVFTQVLVIAPEVHPVVRPTLLTVAPTARQPPRVPVQSSEVMLNEPTMSKLPLFAPLVRAIR